MFLPVGLDVFEGVYSGREEVVRLELAQILREVRGQLEARREGQRRAADEE